MVFVFSIASVAAHAGLVAVTKEDDAAVKIVAALRNCARLEIVLDGIDILKLFLLGDLNDNADTGPTLVLKLQSADIVSRNMTFERD